MKDQVREEWRRGRGKRDNSNGGKSERSCPMVSTALVTMETSHLACSRNYDN